MATIEFDIRCECGENLDVNQRHGRFEDLYFEVTPCEDCIKKAEDKIREELEDEG